MTVDNNAKLSLRIKAKEYLRSLQPELVQFSARKIFRQLIDHGVFKSSSKVACYIAIDNEVNTHEIIEILREKNKLCYLPSVSLSGEMLFIEFAKGSSLIKTRYGTLEPAIISDKIIDPRHLDLVIVPLLGFNKGLYRLGRGAGFYDKIFSFKKHLPPKISPYLVGLGYVEQQVDFLPNSWDVPMDEIIVG